MAAEEFKAAKKAGLQAILDARKAKPAAEAAPAAKMPPKEVVDTAIVGIEVMDLEDAVQVLWGAEIYAESGMGCTGPVIMVSGKKLEKAAEVLRSKGYSPGVE